MKVVINTCFGGFGLSPQALLRLYELGCTSIASAVPTTDVGDPNDQFSPAGSLVRWREYQKNPIGSFMFLQVYSPDEKFLLTEYDLNRADPLLVQVVEELGDAANGMCSQLKVVEIPDDTNYTIQDYDGLEHIAEVHSTWS